MTFVVYDTVTGRIDGVGDCPPEFEGDQEGWLPGHAVLTGQSIPPGSHKTHYVDVSQNPVVVTTKQANPITADKTQITADGVDAVTFSNVPAGTIARGEQDISVDDGVLVMTCDTEITFRVRFIHPAYVEAEFAIEAVAP